MSAVGSNQSDPTAERVGDTGLLAQITEVTAEALAGGKVANEVTAIRDGASAVEHLSTAGADELPDLVILDLNLPRMTGHEVLATTRRSEALRRIPANYFRTKPVDVMQSVQSIDDFWLGLVRLPR